MRDTAFTMATSGAMIDSQKLAQAIAVLAEHMAASQMRVLERSGDLATRLLVPGGLADALQAAQAAATGTLADTNRLAELTLAVGRVAARPFSQFFPDDGEDLVLPD